MDLKIDRRGFTLRGKCQGFVRSLDVFITTGGYSDLVIEKEGFYS